MKEIIKSNEMLKESVDKSIKHLEGKMDFQIKMLMWAIGFLASLLVALKFIKQNKNDHKYIICSIILYNTY